MDIRWRSRMLQASALAAVTCGLMLAANVAAGAGPCTADIGRLQTQIAAAANPVAGPTATQSVGAQLHHQPTPGDVQSARTKADAGADTALDRARKADAQGDAAACQAALRQAKLLYGLANN